MLQVVVVVVKGMRRRRLVSDTHTQREREGAREGADWVIGVVS